MFYLTMHSTHFIYGYMASNTWLRTILIVRKETRCRHIGYSFRLAARVLLYAPSHSRGVLTGTRNSSMDEQIESECLMCTIGTSCCSARLSRAQVTAFAGTGKKEGGDKGEAPPAIVCTREYKLSDRSVANGGGGGGGCVIRVIFTILYNCIL